MPATKKIMTTVAIALVTILALNWTMKKVPAVREIFS